MLSGPIEAVAESMFSLGWQTPNLWWSDERSWCVATEIDLNTTYIGYGSGGRVGLQRQSAQDANLAAAPTANVQRQLAKTAAV